MERISQPVLAGILTALVGFTSSSAIVLTGLRAVRATPSRPPRGCSRSAPPRGSASSGWSGGTGYR